jgi:hypothetical protein
MKFKGTGIVWDPEKNKQFGKFKDGSLETNVKREQAILTKLGYESINEPNVGEADDARSDSSDTGQNKATGDDTRNAK